MKKNILHMIKGLLHCYYRVIALILVNIIPSMDIEGHELSSVRGYPKEGHIHQYQCNNPCII